MSTPEFDKFDLDGLSLEDVEPAKTEKLEGQDNQAPVEEIELAEPVQEIPPVKPLAEPVQEAPQVAQPIEAAPPPASIPAANNPQSEDVPEGKMLCPKCELLQEKAEQCEGCGVYVAKAQAAIGQSKIQITSTKF